MFAEDFAGRVLSFGGGGRGPLSRDRAARRARYRYQLPATGRRSPVPPLAHDTRALPPRRRLGLLDPAPPWLGGFALACSRRAGHRRARLPRPVLGTLGNRPGRIDLDLRSRRVPRVARDRSLDAVGA